MPQFPRGSDCLAQVSEIGCEKWRLLCRMENLCHCIILPRWVIWICQVWRPLVYTMHNFVSLTPQSKACLGLQPQYYTFLVTFFQNQKVLELLTLLWMESTVPSNLHLYRCFVVFPRDFKSQLLWLWWRQLHSVLFFQPQHFCRDSLCSSLFNYSLTSSLLHNKLACMCW